MQNQACTKCANPAAFITPNGALCETHTLDEMDADDQLWMPAALDTSPHPSRVG